MKRMLRLMTWVTVLVVGSCGCPEDCTCHYDQGLYSARCQVLPLNGGKVEVLTVQPPHHRTSPLELADGQFNQARHLKYLSLRNNSIYFMHKKTFYGARGLIEIDLSNNFIEELDPLLFQHLTNLTALILRGNSIQLLPGVPFVVSNSIQHLDIGQCGIKSIPRGIFYGLTRLKYLSLDGNFLKTLKYNSLPKGLKYLNLSNNLIVNVPSEVISSLSNLRRINLGGNPINCSCSLLNLQDWLSGRGVIFEDSVICASPYEYSGISWSKVDENNLCLAETRRQEILSHSAYYSKKIESKSKDKYFQNENNYSVENLQSDQPHLLHSDPLAEMLFKNDETVAMGEMMRDQEVINNKTYLEKENNEKKEEPLAPNEYSNDYVSPVIGSESSLSNVNDLNTNTELVNKKSSGDMAQSNLNGHNDEIKPNEEDISFKNKIEENNMEKNDELNFVLHNSTSSQSPLNEKNAIEYNENKREQEDVLKEEGFFVEESKYKNQTNVTSEESTDYPELGTTEDDVDSTQEPLISGEVETSKLNETSTQSSTNIIPDIGETNINNQTEYETDEKSKTHDMIPDKVENNDNHQNISQLGIPLSTSDSEIVHEASDNKSDINYSKSNKNAMEHKGKEVAGAEVLMFCVGTLLICLILYSVYKCRSSKARKTMRINKDMEANQGTEMQDMATLLPKPQEDSRKHTLKYPNENQSSENIKLLGKNNENENHNHKTEDATVTKIEDKNSLNNNFSSSPTSKTPLVKPGNNQVTINPAAPIQRTKVKVSVIPDSIPRTPIFVQKTYNGTKHA